jgi:hypothetical protein
MSASHPTPFSSSSSPVCEKCARAREEKDSPAHVPYVAASVAGCEDAYSAMNACMDMHRGSISACKAEWVAFTECHRLKHKPLSSPAIRSPSPST